MAQKLEIHLDMALAPTLEEMGQQLVKQLTEAASKGRRVVSVSHAIDTESTDRRYQALIFTERES